MVIAVIVLVLGPIYGVIFWMVSRLPLWVLAPSLGIVATPYLINWEYLMAGGPYNGALPYIFLITVVGALGAAVVFRILVHLRATKSEDGRVLLQLVVGLTGFPVSAVAVLSI
jgi:hypothetical protein